MKEYQNGELLAALAKMILLTVPPEMIKEDSQQLAIDLHMIKPSPPEYKEKSKTDFIPTEMGLSILDDVAEIVSRAKIILDIVEMFKDSGMDLDALGKLANTPPIRTTKPDRAPSSVVGDLSAGIHPGFGRYNISGEMTDLDQVMNMQRVRDNELVAEGGRFDPEMAAAHRKKHEAEDKKQENLAAVGSAAEQRLAREEIYSKAQERAKEIAAEMRKGLKDNGE